MLRFSIFVVSTRVLVFRNIIIRSKDYNYKYKEQEMDTVDIKKQYCSGAQKQALIDMVTEDKDLLNGKFTNSFTLKDAQHKWECIAAKLNAIPGGKKDWKQWKKSWQDIKTKTKNKKALLNRHAKGTGGGPPLPDLTPIEEKVISVIDPTVIEGNPLITESNIEFIFDDDIISHTKSIPETVNPILETEIPINATKKPKTNIKRKRSNSLVNSAEASATLAQTSQERIKIQKEYYDKKLGLLERQTLAIEDLVAFLRSKMGE